MKKHKNIRIYRQKDLLRFDNLKPMRPGVDSSVIIELIDNLAALHYFYEKGFGERFPRLYTHRICIAETRGILIEKYGYSPRQAEDAIESFLSDFNVTIIDRKKKHKLLEKIVFEVGQKHGLNHKTFGDKISPDFIIIAAFWSEGITPVLVSDNAFIDTCKELGLNVVKIPSRDVLLERQLRQLSRKKRR